MVPVSTSPEPPEASTQRARVIVPPNFEVVFLAHDPGAEAGGAHRVGHDLGVVLLVDPLAGAVVGAADQGLEPVDGVEPRHLDRRVEIQLADGEFEAEFRQEAGEFRPGRVVRGRYLVEDGLVASACELRA